MTHAKNRILNTVPVANRQLTSRINTSRDVINQYNDPPQTGKMEANRC